MMTEYPLITADDLPPRSALEATDKVLAYRAGLGGAATLLVLLDFIKANVDVPDSVQSALDALLGGAPPALDTLYELAAALADDENFAATMMAALANKLDANKIGVSGGVQAWSQRLANVAALSPLAGQFLQLTGADTVAARSILGTVSQSGGAPTGALMEKGSNANGDYFRFANGLQICIGGRGNLVTTSTAQGGVYISSAQTFLFPAAFTSIPNVTPIADKFSGGGGICWGALANDQPTMTGVQLFITGVFNTSSAVATYIAEGKWF